MPLELLNESSLEHQIFLGLFYKISISSKGIIRSIKRLTLKVTDELGGLLLVRAARRPSLLQEKEVLDNTSAFREQ